MNFSLKTLNNHKFLFTASILALIGLISHAFNINNFPAFFDDEGTYMSQAWAILELGSLAPYTYWYDHAPLGWLIIAGWIEAVGGFFTFGTSVATGRYLMVILHALSTFLLFFISYRFTKNLFIAAIASLIFSLSPLAITLQRMVFLDNILMPFLLSSLALFIYKKRLVFFALSGFLFGLAILIKETVIFFIPAYLAAIFLLSHKSIRLFALGIWISLVAVVSLTYPLYALLKGELFPSGTFLGGSGEHVSLIETLMWQTSRDGGFFASAESEFQFMLKNSWLHTDSILLVLGTLAIISNLILGIKNRSFLVISLFPLSYTLYLIRGGIVNDQYIIPLIPFLALNISIALYGIYKLLKEKVSYKIAYLPAVLTIIFLALFYLQKPEPYILNQTAHQIETLEWIKKNTSKNDLVVVDAYGFVDLREGASDRIYAVSGVQHYWKIDSDPKIRQQLLNNDWSRINYVIATPKFKRDISHNNLTMVENAIENSDKIIVLKEPDRPDSFNKTITTFGAGGDISIYKLRDKKYLTLTQSWEYYKNNFIHNYGQIVDPSRNISTSEGQSYAMLRAVWLDDQQTYDQVWQWTKDHLQHRGGDSLLSWKWEKQGGEFKVTDSNTASDADLDIALSLIFAYETWGNEEYLDEAKEIISDIWEKEVVTINGRHYLVSSANSQVTGGYLVNPSYISPAAYRIFSEYDVNDWLSLADDSYIFLENLKNYSMLPPDWIVIASSGELISAASVIQNSDIYSFDAFRTMYRVALDYQWFEDERALSYLKSYEKFYSEAYFNQIPSSQYTLNGEPLNNYSALSTHAGALSLFTITNKKLATEIYKNHFTREFVSPDGYWKNENDYYSHNWAWFSLALYSVNSPNLASVNKDTLVTKTQD